MIEFKKVFIQYVSEFFSLYDFSCEIDCHTLFVGDFFSGTTAIMRVLAKIDKNYNGKVFVNNENLKNIKDKDLNLSYLPENPVVFKNKNIFQNLYFTLKIIKINKNIAKNLINSIFLELKNNNFNFLNNYFNIKEVRINNNKDLKSLEFDNILKIKVKNLSLSEQKILTLVRAILRKPKYVLLENFFEGLDKEFVPIANFLFNKLKENSTIIACEHETLETYKDFKIVNLSHVD